MSWSIVSSMKQRILLFARARDLAGGDSVEVEIPEGATVGEMRAALLAQVPALSPIAGSLFVAVNNSYASDETKIMAGAEVACFPPVSGG